MTNAFKVEVLIIDANDENIKESDITTEIEFSCEVGNAFCKVMKVTEKNIGEWSDDHPLNGLEMEEEYRKLFGEKK